MDRIEQALKLAREQTGHVYGPMLHHSTKEEGLCNFPPESDEFPRKVQIQYEVEDPQWPDVQDANAAESSSPMHGQSPKQEPEASQILLDLVEVIHRQSKLIESLDAHILIQSNLIDRIIEALAEDQDPDDAPLTFMDGKPIR